jgi:hypothetical protein
MLLSSAESKWRRPLAREEAKLKTRSTLITNSYTGDQTCAAECGAFRHIVSLLCAGAVRVRRLVWGPLAKTTLLFAQTALIAESEFNNASHNRLDGRCRSDRLTGAGSRYLQQGAGRQFKPKKGWRSS